MIKKLLCFVCFFGIISFIFVSFCFIYIIYASNNRKVNLEDISSVNIYIRKIYDILTSDVGKFTEEIYNNDFFFYVEDSITTNIDEFNIHADSQGFNAAYKEFRMYAGQIKSLSVEKIEFYLQPYDISESKLYFVDMTVLYANIKAYESFYIKKTNKQWKVYRYWINYKIEPELTKNYYTEHKESDKKRLCIRQKD